MPAYAGCRANPPNLSQAREAVERVLRDGKEAGEVVRRVRALFKRAETEKVPLDITEVILEVLDLVQSEVVRRQATVHSKLDMTLPLVFGDRVQLQQLTLNLILNGLEAMDSVNDRTRSLFISAEAASDLVNVKVRDCGVGLTDPEKIFEPFFTTKHDGMGMGLAICRTIVEAHGGRIWAATEEGPGATVVFALPGQSGSWTESKGQ